MNDITTKFNEIQAEADAPYEKLELALKDNDIVLQIGPGCLQTTIYFASAIFALGAYAISRSILKSIEYPYSYIVVGGLLIGTLWLLWKIGAFQWPPANPPKCKIDPVNAELIIYSRGKPQIRLPMDKLECFFGRFYFASSGDSYGGRAKHRQLYAVTQDGMMYCLSDYDPDASCGERITKELAYICEKPYYLTEEGMDTSQFLTKVSGNQVFNRDKFVESLHHFSGETLLHPADASGLPTNTLLRPATKTADPSPEQLLHPAGKDNEQVNREQTDNNMSDLNKEGERK